MNIWTIFDLFAPACPACGLPAPRCHHLCAGCDADLPRLHAPCPRCALPMAGSAGCAACRAGDPAIARTVVACAYAHPVDRLVQQLKFGGRLPVARTLGGLLAAAARAQRADLPQCLLPVPLHAGRARERGFNQAEAIARHAGRLLGIAVDADAASRCRDTRAQSGLDLAARRRNLQDAFRVAGVLPAHVAIVDDVITTGSTVLALAAALRAHGVGRVDAWAVARTL